jgi:hypothetical protein
MEFDIDFFDVYHPNKKGPGKPDIYNIYHPIQSGGTSPFYQANLRRQRGSGIGGILGTIARTVMPFLAKYVFPSAKTFVRKTAGDIFSGRNVKETLKEHGIDALKDVGS